MDRVRELAVEHRPNSSWRVRRVTRRLDPSRSKRLPMRSVRCCCLTLLTSLGSLRVAPTQPGSFADVVTFTTHKTLRGPRGGCILAKAEHAAAIDKAVFQVGKAAR